MMYNSEVREHNLVPQQMIKPAYPGCSTNMACKVLSR